MAVGPSAAPMMPMEAAVLRSKPRATEASIVAKMPNWAAAPKKIITGILNRGLKSHMAPTATKISTGNSSVVMPASSRIFRKPAWPSYSYTTDSGRLTRMAPKPIGRSSMGSYSFLIASQIRASPTAYMTASCQVTEVKPISSCCMTS